MAVLLCFLCTYLHQKLTLTKVKMQPNDDKSNPSSTVGKQQKNILRNTMTMKISHHLGIQQQKHLAGHSNIRNTIRPTCPGTRVFPLNSTGSNGLPDANTAAPLDHLYASSGVHSALEVGFESAKMTGLSLLADISSMIVWLNDFAKVDTPMRAVGLRVFTAERRSPTCPARFTGTRSTA